MEEIRELIEKYALQNAVKYKAAPNAGAVMGKLLGEHAELRARAKELSPLVKEVLAGVEKTSLEEWQERLQAIAPELLAELSEKKEPDKGLPALEGAEKGVVMRFAPNPNGPPTLGSARGIIVNSEYVKKYGGKFIIRFDDTDPVKKRPMPEAYGWYLEDCAWLGAMPDLVITASERVDQYYPIAEELIRRGGAYVCGCAQAVFKEHKDKGLECEHRDQSVEQNLDLWRQMLDGRMAEGGAVLRVKTDMHHKDPAIRDWPAFRIVTASHPLVGTKYRVWPLLDFESAVEDHLLGTTHIIRGKDLADSGSRQRYLYAAFRLGVPPGHPLGQDQDSSVRLFQHQQTAQGHRGRRVHGLGRPAGAHGAGHALPGHPARGAAKVHDRPGRGRDGHFHQHGLHLCREQQDHRSRGQPPLLRLGPGGPGNRGRGARTGARAAASHQQIGAFGRFRPETSCSSARATWRPSR